MIELIEPKFGEKTYDCACGTAGFLISTFNYVKKRCAKTKDNYAKLKAETVYGNELTNTAKIAKMNMILAGDGHTNIKQLDSLANPIDSIYDVALCNPPYGQATDFGGYYPVPSNDGDAIFIQHIYKSLKEGGRAAVVIPEGVLFKGDHMLKVRRFLLKNCNITGIISLPQGVFRPYADSKTNIMVFEKSKAGTKTIWFYNLEADGFALNSSLRRPVDENDIPDLLSKWAERKESGKSWTADIRRIEAEGYDLLAETYRPTQSALRQGFESLSALLTAAAELAKIDDDKEYKQITLKIHGKGAVLRDKMLGSRIKTKRQFLARAGEVIISKIDAKLGAMAVVPSDLDGAVVSGDFPLFKVDQSKVDIRYLDYVLRFGDYPSLLLKFAKGTTNRRRVSASNVLSLTIYLPDLAEQEALTNRMDRQEQIVKNCEATIKAMKVGLVDESDFQGNWTRRGLEDVCQEIRAGGTPSRKVLSYFKGDIAWVKSGELEDAPIDSTQETITQEGVDNSNAKVFPTGTVLIALIGATIGRTGLLRIDAATNQNVLGLVPNQALILGEYLMYYLSSLRPHYVSKSRGIAQPSLNASMIKAVTVPVPPHSVQAEIVRRIEEKRMVIMELEKSRQRALEVIGSIVKDKFGIDESRKSSGPMTLSDFR